MHAPRLRPRRTYLLPVWAAQSPDPRRLPFYRSVPILRQTTFSFSWPVMGFSRRPHTDRLPGTGTTNRDLVLCLLQHAVTAHMRFYVLPLSYWASCSLIFASTNDVDGQVNPASCLFPHILVEGLGG